MDNDVFNYIISRLIDNAKDAKSDEKGKPGDMFSQGRSLAYYEVLDTIRNILDVYEYDLSECGLEEDPMIMLNSQE